MGIGPNGKPAYYNTSTGVLIWGRPTVGLVIEKAKQIFGDEWPDNRRRLGTLEASGDLTVVQECLVGAFLLLLMFMVYLFTRRFTAPKASGSNPMRIVRKKAPVMYKLL